MEHVKAPTSRNLFRTPPTSAILVGVRPVAKSRKPPYRTAAFLWPLAYSFLASFYGELVLFLVNNSFLSKFARAKLLCGNLRHRSETMCEETRRNQ